MHGYISGGDMVLWNVVGDKCIVECCGGRDNVDLLSATSVLLCGSGGVYGGVVVW